MKKTVRPIRQFHVIFFISFVLVSCAKKPINGDLDGRWQLMTIDLHEDGSQTQPKDTYYDVSLNLMELKQKKENQENLGLFGLKARFNHTEDSLHIRMINCKQAQMPPFGMNDTIQHFAVEELNKKKMVLNSEYARLEFRKF